MKSERGVTLGMITSMMSIAGALAHLHLIPELPPELQRALNEFSKQAAVYGAMVERHETERN